MSPFIQRWVSPFYLRILHGNYASRIVVGEERTKFNGEVRIALAEITPEIATKLLSGYWREAITGSWLAGLKRFPECQHQIGRLLLQSKTCYAGQSHAFAMACYADDASVEFLTRYLDTYLRKTDCCYDQGWAMPALMWIDEQQRTDHAAQFLSPGGLWEQFTADKVSDNNDSWTIQVCKANFWRSMEYCCAHFMT